MRHRRLALLIIGITLLSTQSAPAQQTVQQPIVEQLSVDTVVSVPDRGRLVLGGVGAAGATRKDFGPIPWGTSNGRFTSSSSLDVGVFIHDFEAMDDFLLNEPARRPKATPFRSPRAARAWRSLHSSP